jgi:hypothetical protein
VYTRFWWGGGANKCFLSMLLSEIVALNKHTFFLVSVMIPILFVNLSEILMIILGLNTGFMWVYAKFPMKWQGNKNVFPRLCFKLN